MPNPDLFGWDTVFAVPLSLFNAAIKGSTAYERHFSFASSGTGLPDSELNWVFGRWQVDDAYGAQFTLSCAIESGTLKSAGKSLDLAQTVCRLTVNMILKSNADHSRSAPAADMPATGDPWANVDVDYSLDIGDEITLQVGFATWFLTQDGSEAFDAIFKGLEINLSAAGKTQWLRPKASRFAGAALPDNRLAIGFLASTISNSADGRPLNLSPFAIPADAEAAFLISPERVLAGMVAPALPAVFGTSPDTVVNDFPVLGGNRISNAVQLTFTVTTENRKTYTAAIAPNDLSIVLANDLLTITIKRASFEIDLGKLKIETINIRTVEQLRATLIPAQDDPLHRVLFLTQAAAPIIEHDTEESLYELGGELLVGIVTAIAAGLITKFVPGGLASRFGISMLAAKIWAGILVLLATAIGMVIAKTPDLIAGLEDADLKMLPSFRDVIDGALSAVEWPTPLHFDVDSVIFADCLLVKLKHTART